MLYIVNSPSNKMHLTVVQVESNKGFYSEVKAVNSGIIFNVKSTNLQALGKLLSSKFLGAKKPKNLGVGSGVSIKPSSKFYIEDDQANPINLIGDVVRITDQRTLNINVRWSNGVVNAYNLEDLEVL